MAKSKPITYKNTTYASLKQLSETSDIDYKTLQRRIHELGWTVERAMETPKRKFANRRSISYTHRSISYTYKETEYTSIYSLGKACGIPPNALNFRINRLGWSIDKAIETPVRAAASGKVRDEIFTSPVTYNGKLYTTLVQLGQDYGINPNTLYYRMCIKNMTLEQAIETPVTSGPVVYKDKVYPSITSLAKVHGVDVHIVYARLKRGQSIEQAIDTPIRAVYKKKKGYIDSKLFTILDRTDSTLDRTDSTVSIKCPLCTHVFSKSMISMHNKKRLICPNCNYNSMQKKRYIKLVGKTYYGYTIISFEYRGRQNKEPYFLIKHNDTLLSKPMTIYELLCLIKDKTG